MLLIPLSYSNLLHVTNSAKLLIFLGFTRLAVHYFFGYNAVLGNLVLAIAEAIALRALCVSIASYRKALGVR